MASAAQIWANRENAQRSTGPRTDAGKQATKFNALKHGLAAESLVIRGEDPAALDALRAQLRADHSPVGQIESMLVEEIAQCWWRLQRARAQEQRSITGSIVSLRPYNEKTLDPIVRYMSHAERGWHRAITQLRSVQNDRRKHQTCDPANIPNPQSHEDTQVMAVGSVPRSDVESVVATPQQPEIGSDPQITPIRESKEFKTSGNDRFMEAMMQELEGDFRKSDKELRRERR